MSRIRTLVIAIAVSAAPVSAFGQAEAVVNPSGGSMVIPNPVPGGITLVPGTVVIPAVGGTTVTGTVPLAGTVGSAGVRDFNPGLSAAPNAVPGSDGALYPPPRIPRSPCRAQTKARCRSPLQQTTCSTSSRTVFRSPGQVVWAGSRTIHQSPTVDDDAGKRLARLPPDQVRGSARDPPHRGSSRRAVALVSFWIGFIHRLKNKITMASRVKRARRSPAGRGQRCCAKELLVAAS